LKVGFHVAEAFTGCDLTGDQVAVVLNGAPAMCRHLRAPGR
jgi:hypothetical protein